MGTGIGTGIGTEKELNRNWQNIAPWELRGEESPTRGFSGGLGQRAKLPRNDAIDLSQHARLPRNYAADLGQRAWLPINYAANLGQRARLPRNYAADLGQRASTQLRRLPRAAR